MNIKDIIDQYDYPDKANFIATNSAVNSIAKNIVEKLFNILEQIINSEENEMGGISEENVFDEICEHFVYHFNNKDEMINDFEHYYWKKLKELNNPQGEGK